MNQILTKLTKFNQTKYYRKKKITASQVTISQSSAVCDIQTLNITNSSSETLPGSFDFVDSVLASSLNKLQKHIRLHD